MDQFDDTEKLTRKIAPFNFIIESNYPKPSKNMIISAGITLTESGKIISCPP